MDEIESTWPTSDIEANIYCPHDLLRHIVAYALSGDELVVPKIEIVVAPSGGQRPRMYSSEMRWNGRAAPSLPGLLSGAFGESDLLTYVASRASGEVGAFFGDIVSTLDFVFPMVRADWSDGEWIGVWLELDPSGELRTVSREDARHRPLDAWLVSEKGLVEELCLSLRETSLLDDDG